MTRDELVEAGAEAIKPALLTYAQALARPSPIHLAQVMIHAVEPLIRADERALIGASRGLDMPAVEDRIRAANERIRDATAQAQLADLRAQVAALPDTGDWIRSGLVVRADVLALFDGSSDE